MHEFSISSEIVRTVLETAEKNDGRKVLFIQLEVGELMLLNVEQITFWIHELFKGSPAEEAEVKVRMIQARIACKTCGYRGKADSERVDVLQHFVSLYCPKCRSLQVKVEREGSAYLRKSKF